MDNPYLNFLFWKSLSPIMIIVLNIHNSKNGKKKSIWKKFETFLIAPTLKKYILKKK